MKRDKLHILVIDGDARVCETLRRLLTLAGHTVAIALTGREGLDQYRVTWFDVILLDKAMPDLGGDALAATIKQISPEQQVIMITGFGDLIEKKPPHVDMILSKPIEPAALLKALHAF